MSAKKRFLTAPSIMFQIFFLLLLLSTFGWLDALLTASQLTEREDLSADRSEREEVVG